MILEPKKVNVDLFECEMVLIIKSYLYNQTQEKRIKTMWEIKTAYIFMYAVHKEYI